jgi:hypothetical protein
LRGVAGADSVFPEGPSYFFFPGSLLLNLHFINLDFGAFNHQTISFCIRVNLKNNAARNHPYSDIIAVEVTRGAASETYESPEPLTSSPDPNKQDERLDGWLAKRMQSNKKSPAKPSLHKSNQSNAKLIKCKFNKSDPGKKKYDGPSGKTESAPATPLKQNEGMADVPSNYNDFMAVFSSSRKPSKPPRCDASHTCSNSTPRLKNVDTSPRSTPILLNTDNPCTNPNKTLLDAYQKLKKKVERLDVKHKVSLCV